MHHFRHRLPDVGAVDCRRLLAGLLRDGPWLGNINNMFLGGIGVDSMLATIPGSLLAVFQITFTIIKTALVFGAYAGRMKFAAVLFFSVLWLLFVHLPVTH